MNRGEQPGEAAGGAEGHSGRRIVLKALTEVWRLFVDDGALAGALVVWCALATWGLAAVEVAPPLRAPLLLIGCVLILITDVLVAARRQRVRLSRAAKA